MGRGHEDYGHTSVLKNYEQLLREGNAYSGATAKTSDSGLIPYNQLYNPADSGVYLIVKEVYWYTNAAAYLKFGSLGSIGTSLDAYGNNRFVGGPLSSGEIRSGQGNSFMPDVFYGAQAPVREWQGMQNLYVTLPPGTDFTVYFSIINQLLQTIILWFEVTDY